MKLNREALELADLNEGDTRGLVELSASVDWDYDEDEVGTLLSSSYKIFGHKNSDGKLVSSAAVILYDHKLASIGMVIVHSDYRGLGLGKEVMQNCMDCALDRSIMLIATADGQPLYEKLGFTVVDSVHKYLCDKYAPPNLKNISEISIETFKEEQLEEVIELDEGAFGDKRSNFLRNRIQQSNQCIVVKDENSRLIGFGLSVLGPVNMIIGPVVAPDYQIAQLIIHRLACDHQGKLRVDVPSGQEKLMGFLEQSGFVKVNNPPIMAIHTTEMPPRNHTLFTIASQAYG